MSTHQAAIGTRSGQAGSPSARDHDRGRADERGQDDGEQPRGTDPGHGVAVHHPVRGAPDQEGERAAGREGCSRGASIPRAEKNTSGSDEPGQDEEVGAARPRADQGQGGDEQPRPGEQPRQQDGHVVEEGAGVPVDGRREALQVVIEEERVHERAAFGADHEDVPGRGDENEEGPSGAATPGGAGTASRARRGRSRRRRARAGARRAAPWPGWRGRRTRTPPGSRACPAMPRAARARSPIDAVTLAASSMSMAAARP